MDIKLNLSYYTSIMLDAFKDLYIMLNYAGIIVLGLISSLIFALYIAIVIEIKND